MMRLTLRNRQKGIGLIEALVAALVFALGTLSLIKLQEVIYRQASVAQARYAAMALAEEKLEDLRSFQTYNDADNDVFDFTSIGNNTGGQCDNVDNDACTLNIQATNSSKTIVVGNISYSRDWTATDYYYSSAGVLTTTPNGNIEQKAIAITVTWIDIDGTNRTLTLNGIINHNSGESGGLLTSNTGGSGESPQVNYTPSPDIQVTPVQVGTSSKRETLVPGSETVGGYTFTEFTAYTYDTGGVLIRQEDFKNVACKCAFDGVSTDANKTYGPSYPAWDSAKGTYVDVTGELIAGKVQGCVDENGNGACDANPNAYCEVCCRDHHDSASATRKYDPYRSTDDYDATTYDHKHHFGTATSVTSGTYIESCRLKRINGFWRAYQDWHQVGYKLLSLADLTDTTKKATYADYVNDVIDEHLDESKVQGETLTSPPSFPSTLEHTVSGSYISLNVGDTSQMSARGIYLDYMDSTHLAQVQAKKTASQDYLLHVPYYEVDVTSVSNWTSGTGTSVRVGPYDGPGTSNDLVAGQLAGLTTNATAVPVSGTMKKSVSGLTHLSVALDYNATTNPDTATNTHAVNVCIGCSGAASCSTPWGGSVASGSSVTAAQAATVVSPASCTYETRTCNNGTLSGSYQYQSCSVISASDCTAPWGTTVVNGASVLAYLSPTPPDTCASQSRTCTSGVLSGSYLYASCTVTPVTCITSVSGKANNKDDSIVINDGTTDYSCSVATTKSYTCPAVTTSTNATITVTSSGTVDLTTTLSTICGSQTVNF